MSATTMRTFQLMLVCIVLWLHLTVASTIRQCKTNQQCVEIKACNEAKKDAFTNVTAASQSARNQACRLKYCDRIGVCCDSVSYHTECSQLPHAVLPTTRNGCGRVTDRLIYKTYAWIYEYNWMALLRNVDGEFSCAGSLITPGFILTAAQCATPAVVSVRLGENDLSKDVDCDDFGEPNPLCADLPVDIAVDKFIKHPLYDALTRANDIALVRLVKTIKYTEFKSPVCLPIGPLNGRSNVATVSGWGHTQQGRKYDVLHLAHVSIIPASECTSVLGRPVDATPLSEGQFCAGGNPKEDNFAGDLGGPLQFRIENMVQYGIMSYRTNSTDYAVYTNVSHYIDWIRENLK